MKNLMVTYESEKKCDPAFDKEIEALAKKFGLTFDSSGYNTKNNVREIWYMTRKSEKK